MLEILNRLDTIAPLLALLLILPAYSKSHKSAKAKLKPILIFILVQAVLNLSASAIEFFYDEKYKNHILLSNNYWIHWLNTIISFVIVVYILSFIIHVISNKAGTLINVLFLLFVIVMAFLGDGTRSFNSYSAGISSLVIISLCLLFFYQILKGSNNKNTESPDTPLFWCISGIFTYYFGAFFIFLTYQYLISSFSSGFSLLWRFHNVLLLICCIYIVCGFLWKSYQTKY